MEKCNTVGTLKITSEKSLHDGATFLSTRMLTDQVQTLCVGQSPIRKKMYIHKMYHHMTSSYKETMEMIL
jgi:hypothetical protein